MRPPAVDHGPRPPAPQFRFSDAPKAELLPNLRSTGTAVSRLPSYCHMKLLLCGGMVAFACASTACVVGVDSQGQIVREEKRFSLEGTPEVHLGTFDGAIEIRSSDTKQY